MNQHINHIELPNIFNYDIFNDFIIKKIYPILYIQDSPFK